jgi:hypothetical protein
VLKAHSADAFGWRAQRFAAATPIARWPKAIEKETPRELMTRGVFSSVDRSAE